MNDTIGSKRPDPRCVFEVASQQAGYFTARQARRCGYSWALLSHHVKGGRFLRVRRGLYRLQQFPTSQQEEVIAAWLSLGPSEAVVSHESALDLLGLSDVVPSAIHLMVHRSHRPGGRQRTPPGVKLHTTTRPLNRDDIVIREGVRLSSPARAIVDAAEAGTGPEQILLAVRQAIQRGLVTRSQLIRVARGRGQRVEQLIKRALEEAAP